MKAVKQVLEKRGARRMAGPRPLLDGSGPLPMGRPEGGPRDLKRGTEGRPEAGLLNLKNVANGDSEGCGYSGPLPLNEKICIRRCRCKCWFCPDCARSMGSREFEMLKAEVGTWGRHVMMLTLTVDGELFDNDPERAYRYVMQNKLIARFMRSLYKRGQLSSLKYFYVLEPQGEKANRMPHWHVCCQSRFVDHGIMAEIWSKFRPAWAGPLVWDPCKVTGEHARVTAENYRELGRVAFGGVWFSIKPHLAPSRAVSYCVKYLTKVPAAGWPEWVLRSKGIQRIRKSNNFYPEHFGHAPDCFCDDCREGEAHAVLGDVVVEDAVDPSSGRPAKRLRLATIGERIARCGQAAALTRYVDWQYPDGRLVRKAQFWGLLPLPWEDVLNVLQIEGPDERSRFFYLRNNDEEVALWQAAYCRERGGNVPGDRASRDGGGSAGWTGGNGFENY